MDEDDNECLPIPRRSLINEIHDHIEISPNNHRSSHIFLNNSTNSNYDINETIQTPLQLITLYEKTIEFVAKNKINAKNAFQFSLVERLPEILDIIAFDEKNNSFNHYHEPNFVKVGNVIDTSAKIYAYRVDALHTDTQKFHGNIQEKEEKSNVQTSELTLTQRNKLKVNSYLVMDLSSISLSYEFQFHPFQPSNMCHWPGGVGFDSFYADMISYTMYSSSDFSLLDSFIDLNSRINQQSLDQSLHRNYDLISLRETIKDEEEFDHYLGCQTLREFTFNENSTESYIETINECSIIDNNIQIFNQTCSELRDDQSNFYFQELQSAHTFPTTMLSMDMTYLHNQISFIDQIPQLIRDKKIDFKTNLSEYSYFDSTKLKLFAGPYLWKYKNLLPNFKSHSNKIISYSRTHSMKIQFENIHSLDKFMYNRKSKLKRLQNLSLSTNNKHQLCLSRKIRPLIDLFSLNYFPDYYIENFNDYSSINIDDDNNNQSQMNIIEQIDYDFIRPIHYEKIEFDQFSKKINAKKLQIELNDQYNKQLNTTSHPISLSSLCFKLVNQGILSSENDQLISAFYCLLNNCNKNDLYLKNTLQYDDLIIQSNRPSFRLT